MRHRLYLVLLIGIAATACAVIGPNDSLNLAWDPGANHGPGVTYEFRWGTNSGSYQWSQSVGTNRTVTVTNLTAGTLYFAVFAVAGTQVSPPSNEILEENPPDSALRLRITKRTPKSVGIDGTTDGMSWRTLAIVTNDPALLAAQNRQMIRAFFITNPPAPQLK